MDVKKIPTKFNLPGELIKALEDSGVTKLFPPQELAINRGVLNGENFVLACPTASGKTLIAELCMLKNILLNRTRCLYIVPLRALASEKYEEFRTKYGSLNVNVGVSTGDYDVAAKSLRGFHILVATSEKVDSLLRQRCDWLTNNLSVAVFDEVHFLNDKQRGPTLEILLSRIRIINPKTQILALSATISNAREIASWLGAQLVESNWRPVPLKEGVYLENKINFDDGSSKQINLNINHEVTKLALDTVKEGGQALVFLNTRVSSQTQAKIISSEMSGLSQIEKNNLKQVSSQALNTLGEPTKICKKLSEAIKLGVAFHHAGLHPKQRKLVEDNFRNNTIKIVCATPTLAAGVNLPARRVIIRDFKRYSPGLGQDFIPVFEYKQYAGRAGRPQYDKFGESVLVAKTSLERKMLFSEYIYKDPEPIQSKLNNEACLRTHILSSIASGFTNNMDRLRDFFKTTFYAFQNSAKDLAHILYSVVDFLKKEEFIKESTHSTRPVLKHGVCGSTCSPSLEPSRAKSRGSGLILSGTSLPRPEGRGLSAVEVSENTFRPTLFGTLTSRLYIDPLSALILRNGLRRATLKTDYFALLHLACCCSEIEELALNKNDYHNLEIYYNLNLESLLVPFEDVLRFFDFDIYLAQLKTSIMLSKWIEEEKEENICVEFKIGPGDIRRLINSAGWLMYCSYQLAKIFGLRSILPKTDKLVTRLHYGVKEELLELVGLKGIGRVRARSLYSHGFETLSRIKTADIRMLTKIPHIGEKIATSIKEQLVPRNIRF